MPFVMARKGDATLEVPAKGAALGKELEGTWNGAVEASGRPWATLRGLSTGIEVYLIDGTYELFRHYYAVPSAIDRDGREVGAVRGVLASLLGMMTAKTTYIGVATDHVIESFRNALWLGHDRCSSLRSCPLLGLCSSTVIQAPLRL